MVPIKKEDWEIEYLKRRAGRSIKIKWIKVLERKSILDRIKTFFSVLYNRS